MSENYARPSLRFPWEMLNAIIGGSSAIDIRELEVYSLQEADNFIKGYGYCWDNPSHRRELETLHAETLVFIEQELINDESHISIPPEIRNQRDIRHFLVWATQRDDKKLQQWSCAFLRVLHTLAHCNSYFNDHFGEQIRDQIYSRFWPHLHEGPDGISLGKVEDGIPLHTCEFKKIKSKHSMAMKLLHKLENVSSNIFDRIGVRIVTHDRLDALMVVRYLRIHNVFMFANVMPSRSRNTLLDLDWVRREIEHIEDEFNRGVISRKEIIETLRQELISHPYPAPPQPSYNPYSSAKYHAIQFTCRQMIRVKHPQILDLANSLHTQTSGHPQLEELSAKLLQQISSHCDINFFFPFEIQILDLESFQLSREGMAAHSDYKRRQRDAVKRRVLGAILLDRR